ncbi:hypothetical protein V6N12_051621 [Hibiscus sabdariffa]|uniref:RNase H type-1 domain-containing protein n=1 Tax=Hibiscus sabdariffa TaxID=183260 RepID=A0ABR2GGN9_9ROSI
MGFSRFIGICSILDAELWDVLEGLNHVWNLGYRKIEVELDSLTVVRIIHGKVSVGAHSNLINHVHEILRRDWEITFTHIFREANTIADELAKMDTSGHVGGCIFRYPRLVLKTWCCMRLVLSRLLVLLWIYQWVLHELYLVILVGSCCFLNVIF